jgi:hypothetical protein
MVRDFALAVDSTSQQGFGNVIEDSCFALILTFIEDRITSQLEKK